MKGKKVRKNIQHEDAALKVTMRFFAEELLPCFGITEKVAGFADYFLYNFVCEKSPEPGRYKYEN